MDFFNSEFWVYLTIGWRHIIDIRAYDHLLFIITLCALFEVKEWKKLGVIITAFTIGHSVTLALSTLHIIPFSSYWVELLIPVTIMLTAIFNVAQKKTYSNTFDKRILRNYILAMVFGCIHGMGFANSFQLLASEGESIVKQLLAFNIGLELGQIAIISLFMLLFFALTQLTHIAQRNWTLFVSGAGFGVALTLFIEILLG